MNILGRLLLSLIITIIIGEILDFVIDFNSFTKGSQALDLFLLMIGYGIPNFFFLIIVFIFIGKEYVLKIKLMLFEVSLFYLILGAIHKIINMLPYSLTHIETPTISGQKEYITDGYLILYSFIVLFIILYFIKKLRLVKSSQL